MELSQTPTPAPEKPNKPFSSFDHASIALLTAVGFVMLATLDDYGFTYDEPPHIRYGERILNFYASGFAERRGTIMSYVGGFDLLAALVRRVSPFDALYTNHLVCVFVAQCGLLGTWKLGRFLGGSLAGFVSVVCLLSIPVYYGHQFNNPKDVPFAAGYIWGLYYIAKWLALYSPLVGEEKTPAPWSFYVKFGLALGCGMAVRVGGALLIGYLGLFVALAWLECKRTGHPLPWPTIKTSALPLAGAVTLSWVLMVAMWPKAILSPLKGPAEAAKKVSNFQAFDSPTLFRGKMISSHKVPWDYLPTYFVQQLPEVLVVCLVATTLWIAIWTYRAFARRQTLPLGHLLLLCATFLPPTYAAVRHSVLYDGLRHFLFLMPPIAVLCALGVTTFLRHYRSRRLAQVATLGFGLFVADQVHALSRLHPHQHVYFNRMSGGTHRAAKRFETEYYGSVYRELTKKLQAYLWRTDKTRYLNTTYAVAGCGSKLFFTENLPVNFNFTPMRAAHKADIYVTYARDRCLERFTEYPAMLRVTRDGATLGIARSLNKSLAPKAKKRKGRK